MFQRYAIVILLLALFIGGAASVKAGTELPLTTEKINADSINLTAGEFFEAFTSTDIAEREKAKIYLLGVMDATEGNSWCDYRTFKTVTLRERIYVEFKKLPQDQLNQRAAKIIERILSQRYTCERGK